MFYKNIKSQAQQFLDNYKQKSPATYAAAQQAIGGLLILDGFIGIDNPLGGKKRSGIFGSLIGIILGLIFIFGTGFAMNVTGVNKMTATTTASVTSISQPTPTATTTPNGTNTTQNNGSSCTPTASYTVNGTSYTQTSTTGSTGACSLVAGQTITINYDPDNPGRWAYDLNTVKTILKLFPIVGIVALVVSAFTFLIRLLSIIFGWKLLSSGRRLAKTLPAGTDLGTIKKEIKENFAQSIFSLGAGKPTASKK